jgi:ABC-type uncharacterized transport system permease subunit
MSSITNNKLGVTSYLDTVRGYLKSLQFRNAFQGALQPIVAIIIALLIGAILILIVGENPIDAYAALFKGAVGSPSAWLRTLRMATPLLFTGLAAAVAFRAGIINLGIEGSLYLGALASALTGIYISPLMPMVFRIPVSVMAGVLAGGLWAYIPGYMKIRLRVDEVVSTLMLNYIAIQLVDFIVYNYFQDPIDGANAERATTVHIPATARLPFLSSDYSLSIGILFGIALIILFVWIYSRSKWGYESDMTGFNRKFSKFGGVNITKIALTTFVISGMLGGLAGTTEILGSYGRYVGGFSTGLGFDGITIALMGRLNPVGVFISAIFFAALKNGGASMELATNVPRDIVVVIQGLILLIVTAQVLFAALKIGWRTRAEE